MSAVPLRTHIRLENLSRQGNLNVDATGDASGNMIGTAGAVVSVDLTPIYLWSVFFKVDGATVTVNSALKLQGTATVVGTVGNQGDLPGGLNSDGKTPIPSVLGDCVT